VSIRVGLGLGHVADGRASFGRNDLPRLLALFCCGEWLLNDGIFDDEGGSCGSDGPGSRDVSCGMRQAMLRGVICGRTPNKPGARYCSSAQPAGHCLACLQN